MGWEIILVLVALVCAIAVVPRVLDRLVHKVYFRMVGTARKLRAYARNADNPAAFRWAAERGAVNIDVIIMVFVAFMILFQFIPQVGDLNATVQASDNVSAMGKFATGLGEWMFPLFGILGLVFLLWKQKGSKKGGT